MDTALFGVGSGTVTGAGAVDTLSLSAGGPWTFNADIQANRATIDDTVTVTAGYVFALGMSASSSQVALAVAPTSGSTGNLTVIGSGSQVTVTGNATIGFLNPGRPFGSGIGTVNVVNGGTLAVSDAVVVASGSRVTVDQSSTLSAGAIILNGGLADLYTLPAAVVVAFGSVLYGGTLRVHALNGNATVNNFSAFDTIDFVGVTTATLSGTTVSTVTGSLALGAAPANSSYTLESDGNGGTLVAVVPQTIGVYRFFDTTTGTHFYTADTNEAATVRTTRPDLTPEGPGGLGLQAEATPTNDPYTTPVYRFFDTTSGTHFFTASSTERYGLIASRPDLTYEPNSTFYEHFTPQPGDAAVYRFFDTVNGTHFYTDSNIELASIRSTRSDLLYEGISFYEPHQNN